MSNEIIIDDKLMSYSGDDLAFRRYDPEHIVELGSSCRIFSCRCRFGGSAGETSAIELARIEILKSKNS